MSTSDSRIFQLTWAIPEEILSLFVLMAIDYLSTCFRGGIIKHSTGLARSDAGMAKQRETGRERQADRGAVKHLTRCQSQGGASWSSPHSLALLQEISMLQLGQLDKHLGHESGGTCIHTQRNSFLHAMNTPVFTHAMLTYSYL